MLKQLEALLTTWGIDWMQFKLFVAHATSISNDAMHVFLGLFAQLALAGLLRASVARVWPWAAVLLAELANEWGDLRFEKWPDPGMQWGESAKDLVLTMVLPTVLLGLARWKPGVLGVETTPVQTIVDD